jgi:uncharacterized membrane protein
VNTTLTGPVAAYLAQVRAELSDLPPGELEDVLEDVGGHLTEVAAEFEDAPTATALQDRLGSPRQYADELRNAAGYPPRTRQPVDSRSAQTALRWGVIAATVGPFFVLVGIFSWSADSLASFGLLGLASLFIAGYLGVRALGTNGPRVVLDTPQGADAAGLIRNLIEQIPPNVRRELVTIGQPVWWVARGLVAGGGFFLVFGAGAVTVVGALAGAAISIWIGRRTQQDARWLWYVVPLNVVATVLVPAWLAASFVGATPPSIFHSYNDYRGSSSSNYNPPAGLVLDGRNVSNIYPFDEQGRQVKVRLYDENGQPINLPLQDCAADFGQSSGAVSNLFPQAVVSPAPEGTVDETDCKDTDKAPFIPPPAPATTPAGTPSPVTPTSKPTPQKPGVTLTVSPTR